MKEKNQSILNDDVKEMVKHTITLEYDEVTDVTPDVRITLYNAGHILGSAMVHLHIGNGLHNMLYTADMKYAQNIYVKSSSNTISKIRNIND